MTFKIWHKLALILIISITMAVMAATLMSRYSFKNSFRAYIEQQQQQRLEVLADNLLMTYKENNSWEFIRNKKRLWFFFLRLKPGQYQLLKNNKPLLRRIKRQESRPNNRKPKRLRMALLDINKQIIVGPLLADTKTEYYPLKNNGQIVAYIQKIKFSGITNQMDKVFAGKQDQAFLFNMISTLLIAILAALLISFYFTRRINALTHIAHQLTSGDYQQRLKINEKDELAQLGTDINHLAETLQKNRHSQQQWIADISHELRTPITILSGELQALSDGIRPLNKQAVSSLQQETERLNKLIEDLYLLSIADMGALKYEKRPFDIMQLIKEATENFSPAFKQQNIQLSNYCHHPVPLLFNGDKQRLYQLLSNLLQNSLRYTDAGGQVFITCQDSDTVVQISISDSAPGVAREKLAEIFERLSRIDSSRSRKNGGAGLGLAIAQQIVLAHQGKIFAEPSKLGGISITFILPK